jgi:hypothetical protein
MQNKKSMFFTVDGLFAGILIVFGLIISFSFFIEEEGSDTNINYLSQDIVNSLANIKISEVNDSYIKTLISNGNISNLNNSVIEQIGEFYVLNNSELALNLSRIVTEKLVPEKYGFEILVNDEAIFSNNSISRRTDDLISYRRLVSGFEKFKPLKGATSKVYLEGFNEKLYNSYLYFGGFVGQGNISIFTDEINSQVNLTGMYMEMDSGGDFKLYVNDNQCGGIYYTNGINMTANYWNLTSCLSDVTPGARNNFSINFIGDINESYIGGGYIKVVYKTNEFTVYSEPQKIKYWFPEINGLANLYDSFYVPGSLISMNIYLHFSANETAYLTVGGRIIHEWPGVNDSDQIYNITNQNLSTVDYLNLSVDYTLFSNNTVPIRFASYEDSVQVVTSGDADVVLITDLSGSMKKATDSWGQGNSAPTCSNYFNNPNTRRTRAAVCLDLEMVDIVMNYSGNRMWPIFMRDDKVIDYTWDPENKADVENQILSYYNDQGKGKTCLACAINLAYNLLNQYSNDSRSKFIVMMTDGTPTHCAKDSCMSNSTEYGDKQCNGLCDQSGSCDEGDIPNQCTECTNNNGATNNSLYSAQRAKDDLNVTIFTIGFGPMGNCSIANETLYNLAIIGNGTYQQSKNTSELRLIYANISQEILTRINQETQFVTLSGGDLSRSILFGDSYIEAVYDPFTEGPAFDEIGVSIQTEQFNSCSPSIEIPNELRVTDARIVSYSGSHWTDGLILNNNQVFNLSDYFLNYVRLGDPYFVYIPVNKIVNGTNNLFIRTGDSPENYTGCSNNNSMIYTGLIKSSVSYSDVLEKAEGCNWFIEFEDGENITVSVPPDYTGSKTCTYSNASIDYDEDDTYDDAMFRLLDNLDYDDDGRIFLNLEKYDFQISALSVGKIPYPWGPAIAEIRVWK